MYQEKICLEIFFSTWYFNFKYKYFQVQANRYFHCIFIVTLKLKHVLNYLTAGRAVEKTSWVAMQLYTLTEAEHTLISLYLENKYWLAFDHKILITE